MGAHTSSGRRSGELHDELAAVIDQISPTRDSRGMPSLIDPTMVVAAAETVRDGLVIGIGRPLVDNTNPAPDGHPRFLNQRSVRQSGRVAIGFDRMTAWPHGFSSTHLDAPSHLGLDGRFYPDVDDIDDAPSISVWSAGLVARAVLFDIPRARGSAFVDQNEPVRADELIDIAASLDVPFRAGDAVLLYLGRDRLDDERPGGVIHPAIAPDVAAWLVDIGASILCWDLLDGPVEDHLDFGVHLLLRTHGLPLVDNCELGPAAAAMAARGRFDALLVVAPLNIPGATSSLVNPLLVL